MTEDQWQTCAEPDSMLAFLGTVERDALALRNAERKFVLFTFACLSRWPDLLPPEQRYFVELLEQGYAYAVRMDADNAAEQASELAARVPDRAVEQSIQACYLREIFGNPFRPASVNPSWIAWNDGAIRKVARALYDDRAFDRLPLLADVLEEAGCADREILDHCRSGGEHVRGCWVVDLLLGKS